MRHGSTVMLALAMGAALCAPAGAAPQQGAAGWFAAWTGRVQAERRLSLS